VVDSICDELTKRSHYLTTPIETIYFGGGTPSLLASIKIGKIIDQITNQFDLVDHPEITLEANPEDLSMKKCQELKAVGINRLSIGFQTFNGDKLRWMNRAHNTHQSFEAYKNVRKAKFENVSLDLMYALPEEDENLFMDDLEKIIALGPAHVSLYGLTIEDRTVFGKLKERGELVEMPEEKAAKQYLDAISLLSANDYFQYEVSNFGKDGFHSRHNFSYWNHLPYLGVGPGAHSYDGGSRRFNIRNNAQYVKAIQEGEDYGEEEILSQTEQLNERILTGLRTTKGIDCKRLMQLFNIDIINEKKDLLTRMSEQNLLKVYDHKIKLEAEGFLVADEIALQLFYEV